MDVSSATFARQLMANLDSLAIPGQPPRVLVNREHLPRLRGAAAAGGPGWEALYKRLAALARQSQPASHGLPPDRGALTLAFAFRIWGEKPILHAAIDCAERLASMPSWTTSQNHQPRIDARSALVASSLALCCDLLGDDLPRRTRDKLLHHLEARGVGIFPGIHRSRSEAWAKERSPEQVKIYCHLGIACIAVPEVQDDWRVGMMTALEGILRFLAGARPDGSFDEGLVFWQQVVGDLAWLAYALKTFSKDAINLFEHPFLRCTAVLPLHLTTPAGRLDYGDREPRLAAWLLELLAREQGIPALRRLAQAAEPLDPPATDPEPDLEVRYVLARDDQVLPRLEAPEPLSRHFPDGGIVSLRSHWGSDASTIRFRAAGLDRLGRETVPASLVVAQGERCLIGDFLPVGERSSAGDRLVDRECAPRPGRHCHLLVDERAPGPGASQHARIESVRFEGSLDWVVCDATACYGGRLQWCVRYLIFLRPTCLVIVDDVLAPQARHFRWLLPYADEASLGSTSIAIRNGQHTVHVDFPFLPQLERFRLTDETWIEHVAGAPPDVEPGANLRLVSLSPLHRRHRWMTAAIVILGGPRAGSEGPRLSLERNHVRLGVGAQGLKGDLVIDLAARRIERA